MGSYAIHIAAILVISHATVKNLSMLGCIENKLQTLTVNERQIKNGIMWFESVHKSAALSSKAFIPLLLCSIHVSSRIENAKMGSAISLFTSSDDTQNHPVSFQG